MKTDSRDMPVVGGNEVLHIIYSSTLIYTGRPFFWGVTFIIFLTLYKFQKLVRAINFFFLYFILLLHFFLKNGIKKIMIFPFHNLFILMMMLIPFASVEVPDIIME